VRLVQGIRITDFRSIARADLEGFDDLVPILGPNGSGKSNLFRALNLFFNEYLEDRDELDLRRDFREPDNKRKAKILISVEVDFNFSAFQALRPDHLDALRTLAGDDDGRITFKKEWKLDPFTRDEFSALSAGRDSNSLTPLNTPDTQQLGLRLLGMVRFRYVPNHVHPSQVLEAERDNIRVLLQNRLGQRRILADEVIAKFAGAANDLMKPVREAMEAATGAGVTDVELSTPQNWKDLAWAFGLKLRATQTQSFDTILHGSGIQSVLAYQILHFLDTTFSGGFGWRKGAIWALEEPESFLHAALQAQLARSLDSFGRNEPLQIFLSTHSPAFVGVAESAIVATLDELGRTEFRIVSKDEALRSAYSLGVTPFGHPLHTGPPRPLLLVEGRHDRDLIVRAYNESQALCPYEIRCLEDLDAQFSGGQDEIATWLKYNRPAVQARPSESPIIVLLDWESPDKKVERVTGVLSDHATSRCARWPVDLTNPDLSQSWVGIEKCLSTEFITEFAVEVGLTLVTPAVGRETWRFDVSRQALRPLKSRLHEKLADRCNPADLKYLNEGLDWLNQQLLGVPALC
jgi:predicted ATPase